MQNLGEAEDDEIRRQIRIPRSIPEAGALAGRMLEPLAHRYIAKATYNSPLFKTNSQVV